MALVEPHTVEANAAQSILLRGNRATDVDESITGPVTESI